MQIDNSTPLISIIVPIYNVEKYLEECVLSIINQTWENKQIILVDDGSTDNSGKICDRLQTEYPYLQVIHKKNGGLASARNAGLDIAIGEYVGFVDSDDYVEYDMYEKMYQSMIQTNSQVACCSRYRCIDTANGREIRLLEDDKRIQQFTVMTTEEAIRSLMLNNGITYSACDKLFQADLFSQVRFPKENLPSEDIPCIYSILTKCKQIVHIGEEKYYYRFVSNSISKSPFQRKKISTVRYMEEVVEDVCARYPAVKDEALYALIQSTNSSYSSLVKSGKRKELKDIEKELCKIVRRRFGQIIINPLFPWKVKLIDFFVVLGVFPVFCKVYNGKGK